MSTSSTVEVRVSCSVRWTSKSVGREADAAVARRGPGGRRVLLAAERVEQRPAQVEVERVAELVRLGRLVALPSPPAAIDPVTAECVALEPREQVVEDLLADPPAAARRQLKALAVAGQVAGLLEPPGQVVERLEVAYGVVAEQVADLVAVDRGQVAGRLDIGQRVLQPIHRVRAGRSGRARPRGRAARRRRTGPDRQARPAAAGRGSRQAGRGRPAAGRRAGAPPSSTGAPPAVPGSSSA